MLWMAFCGSWMAEGETLNHMLACVFLELELSLCDCQAGPILYCPEKNSPPDSINLVSHSSLSSGVHDVGCKQHKQTIRKVVFECRKEWQKAGTSHSLFRPLPLSLKSSAPASEYMGSWCLQKSLWVQHLTLLSCFIL